MVNPKVFPQVKLGDIVEIAYINDEYRKDIVKLERVQKRFTRMLLGMEGLKYKNKLERLGLLFTGITIVNRALNQVRPISCTSAFTPSLPYCNSDRVPLILTYRSTSTDIQKIIRHHFHHLHIQGPKHTFQVKQHFICTSKNLVYCIHCSQCGLLYIGEMKYRLGDCFAERLRSAHKKDPELPVARHFNAPPCSLANISISGLLQYSSKPQHKL
eukprot:g38542.t1